MKTFYIYIICRMGMVFSIVQFSSAKLQEYLNDPDKFESDMRSLEKNEIDKPVYLDKSWEAIHFILTGNKIGSGEPPLSQAVYGEQFFDKGQDLGMGPASYLTPEQVKHINALMSELGEDFLRKNYKPEEMDKKGIYPQFWSQNANLIDYVRENFFALKEFYRDAASKGNAIASYLG